MIKRFFLPLFLLTLLSIFTFAQKPKPKPDTSKKPVSVTPKAISGNEKEALEKALAETDLTQKIVALQKFNADFPKSAEKNRVLEIVVSSRAQLADERLRAGDRAGGVELFRQAVNDAPNPVSDKLFSEILVQFPTNLFYRGEQAAAIEVARLIEEKISDNAKQLLGLATFYLGTEDGAEARRIADKSIALDPKLPAAYQTLGLANRLDFQLEESAIAYARALELDPNSPVSKRSLAEMKRATGKTDEAVTLYRELLEKNAEDTSAQTGLTLSLFDGEKLPEAQSELARSLEKNPNNLFLLVGAAYWYAAHREGAKAIEYARKAVAVEPRYTWAHIALARALLAEGKPLEAEKQLLTARGYGNFPTLDYEIASARLAAGFYEEAARELRKNFAVKDDLIETRLGNRVAKQAKSFTELLELERRASIFEPLAADTAENAGKLKSLLRLNQMLSASESKEEELAQAVGEFVKGDDKARIHRELYAASRLLLAKKNLPKVLELTQSAIGGVDAALEVPSGAAAVMADELYESRTLAMSRNEVVIVPEIPHQTLLAILRGRIEEITGWTLYQQDKPQEAVIRLKRAVSVLPEKSAWWRSSTWKLGAALEAAGKQTEALDVYIRNYTSGEPDAVKHSVIESLYKKVTGSSEGLEAKIGAKPVNPNTVASIRNETITQNTEATKTESAPAPAPLIEVAQTPETAATPKIEASPETIPTPKTAPVPEFPVQTEVKPEVKNEEPQVKQVKTEPLSTPIAKAASDKPTPVSTPETKPETTPQASPSPEIKTEIPETKTIESRGKLRNPEPAVKSTPKPLFEPIIIIVPKPEPLKTQKIEAADEKPSETTKSEEQNPENKSSEKSEPSKSKTPVDGSGEVRPRLSPNNSTAESSKSENDSCQLTISQDAVTILSQGGSLGVLLGFQGAGGDVSKITATSDSPNDIEISLEPDIGKQSNRAFFVIKSITEKKGIYTVTFDSPCGKKEVLVKVR